MADPQLLEYIKYELSQNTPRDIMEIKLRHQGWTDEAIDQALNEVNSYATLVATPGPSVSPVPQTKKGMGKLIGIVVGGLVLLLATGGVAAYYYVENLPENRIKKMVYGMETVKSYQYEGSASATVTMSEGSMSDADGTPSLFEALTQVDPSQASSEQSINMEFITSGKVDINDPENPKLAVNAGINMKGNNLGSYAQDIAINGDAILVDKKLFLKINELSDILSSFGGSSASIKPFMNKWITIPLQDQTSNSSSSYGLSPLSAFGSGSAFELEASLSASLKKHEKAIDQAYMRNKFLIITGNKDEKIGNINTSHYSVQIDKAKFLAFLREVLVPVLKDTFPDEADTSLSWDASTEKTFDQFTDYLKEAKIDLWLGKSDNRLYRFDMDLPIEIKSEYSSGTTKMNIKMTNKYQNYNQPMNIVAPEGAKTFEEIMNEYMQSDEFKTSSDLMKKSRDSARLTDLVMLRKAIDASIAVNGTLKLPVCKGDKTETACSSLVLSTTTSSRDVNGKGWLRLDLSDYLATLPIDPKNGETITNSSGKDVTAAYFFRSDGKDYKLATYLEDPTNQAKAEGDGGSDPELFEVGTKVTNEFGL